MPTRLVLTNILNAQKPGVNTEFVSQLDSNLYKCHHLTAEYHEKQEWHDDITLPFR